MLTFILLFLGMMFIRNHTTFVVRSSFLFGTKEDGDIFNALPSYEEMMLHPKHYVRWTRAQWKSYIRRTKMM